MKASMNMRLSAADQTQRMVTLQIAFSDEWGWPLFGVINVADAHAHFDSLRIWKRILSISILCLNEMMLLRSEKQTES